MVACRWLYLPQAWANDAARRKKAGVPEEVVFQTKIEIALDCQPVPAENYIRQYS